MWPEDSMTCYPPAGRPSVSTPPPPTSAVQEPIGLQPCSVSDDVQRLACSVDVSAYIYSRWDNLVATRSAHEWHSWVMARTYGSFIAGGALGRALCIASAESRRIRYPRVSQTASQVHTHATKSLPGNIVVLDGTKLTGSKGLPAYSISLSKDAPCMEVVSEFNVKKLKLKALQEDQ
jgi:hypothetical protein